MPFYFEGIMMQNAGYFAHVQSQRRVLTVAEERIEPSQFLTLY